MKQIILSLIFWSGLLACSAQKITFNKDFFNTQEDIHTNKNTENPFMYHEIKKDLYFNYIFVANTDNLNDCITINAVDITKRKDYSEETHDKLLSFALHSKNTLTFFFKDHFLENAFILFKGCLSYAFDTKKNVIIDQKLSGTMNKDFTLFDKQSHNMTKKLFVELVVSNFRNVATQKDNSNIVTVYVILNNKEIDYFKYNFQFLSENQTLLKELLSNENPEEVAHTVNDEYKKNINEIANTFTTNILLSGGNFYLKHSKKIYFALSYGFTLAQLYLTYSALKDGYNRIGALRSFGKNPKTTTGTVQGLLNIAGLSMTLYNLYRYAKSGLSWVKSKIKSKIRK
jgi:hypothetical protein